MLTKQATQAIHFMVQPLDLCDDRLDVPATCQQVLQPQLADAQFPFPVAQCRCTVEVARLERGFLLPPHLIEFLGGGGQVSGQLRPEVCPTGPAGQQVQYLFPDPGVAGG